MAPYRYREKLHAMLSLVALLDIVAGQKVFDTRWRVIGTHSTFLESSNVFFIRAHRLVAEYPEYRQIRIDNNAETDAAQVVEIGAGLEDALGVRIGH